GGRRRGGVGGWVRYRRSLGGGEPSKSFNSGANVPSPSFPSHDCTTGGSSAGSKGVTAAGVVTDSDPSAALGAGTYSYQATYSGNANYNPKTSPCEPFTIAKKTPGLATTVEDGQNNPVDDNNPAPPGS